MRLFLLFVLLVLAVLPGCHYPGSQTLGIRKSEKGYEVYPLYAERNQRWKEATGDATWDNDQRR